MVAKKPFTDRYVASLKPKSERYEVTDPGQRGLGIRVSPRNRKVWFAFYYHRGERRRANYGLYPEVSLREARRRHAELLRQLSNRRDPTPGRRMDGLDGGDTVAAFARKFVDSLEERVQKGERSPRTLRQYKAFLTGEVTREWGPRRAAEIDSDDIAALLSKISDRGAQTMANRGRSMLSAMFRWGIPKYLSSNPCKHVAQPHTERRGTRVLSPKEIPRFWTGLDSGMMTEGARWALRLLLVTAQRVNEVAQAEWEHLEVEEGWWIIPAEEAKNREEHRVWLSPLAHHLLRKVRGLAGSSEYVFPSIRGDGTNAEEWLARAVARSRDEIGILPFRPRDLRRTASSRMTSMGVPRDIVSRILNHKEQKVIASYDAYSYDAEKKAAWNLWGEKLEQLLGLRLTRARKKKPRWEFDWVTSIRAREGL